MLYDFPSRQTIIYNQGVSCFYMNFAMGLNCFEFEKKIVGPYMRT